MKENEKKEKGIINKMGTIKGSIIINELKRINNMLLDLCNYQNQNDGYGIAFEVFAVSVLHNTSYLTIIKQHLIIGSYDGQIDVVFWDNNHAYYYQIKSYSAKSDTIKIIEKRVKNFKEYGTASIDGDNAINLDHFLILNKATLENKVPIYKVVDETQYGNEKPTDIYKKYFKNKILPQEKNNIVLKLELEMRKSPNGDRLNIALLEGKIYIFIINALKLKNVILTIRDLEKGDALYKLFYDNVRGRLKGKNNAIIKTLLDETDSKYFVDYNNGISITGNVNFLEENGIQIENPIISNGQQTLLSILETQNKYLQKVNVTISVKDTSLCNAAPKNLAHRIAQYTNTQTKVNDIDLLSLNEAIREIQRILVEESFDSMDNYNNGYYLDIYSNGEKEYKEVVKQIYNPKKIIDVSDFLRLYAIIESPKDMGAWKNNISKMLNERYLNNSYSFSFNKDTALKVCKCIEIYNNVLSYLLDQEKRNFRISDLSFQYVLYMNDLKVLKSFKIIKRLNDEYYFENKKSEYTSLMNVYRSNDINKKLDTIVNGKRYRSEKIFNTYIEKYDLIQENYNDFLFWLYKKGEKNYGYVSNSLFNLTRKLKLKEERNVFLCNSLNILETVNCIKSSNEFKTLSKRLKKTSSNQLDLLMKFYNEGDV